MPNCAECKEHRYDTQTIPVIVHESDMERQQQDKKRMWLVIVILIAALILSNLAWALYENSFETVSESYESWANEDSVSVITRQGSVNIGGDGSVYEDNQTEAWGD